MSIRFEIIGIFMVLIATGAAALMVDGTITDYLTGKPIESCQMILDGFSPGAGIDSTTTGSDGRYSFADVSPGVYTMQVSHARYAPDSAFRTFNADQTVSFTLFDLKHLLDSIPDTLYKENSPYVVLKLISSVNNLAIEPGVTILMLQKGGLQLEGNVSAEGTDSNYICFVGGNNDSDTQSNSSGGIWLLGRSAKNFIFTCCRFENISAIHVHGGYRRLTFEHCRFAWMRTAVLLDNFICCGGDAVFRHNSIIDCFDGITGFAPDSSGSGIYDMMARSFIMADNSVRCSNVALYISVEESCHISHNTILGHSLFNMKQLSENDTATNNIFSKVKFDGISESAFFFASNCIRTTTGPLPAGIGYSSLQNPNGDSCDFFYNIFTDPSIADSTTGQLFAGSPCIGAASDGTNMGVYQGEVAGVRQKLTGNGVRRTSRTLRAIFGDRSMVVRLDASKALGAGKYTLSVYSLTGRQLWTNVKMLMTDDHLAPIGGDAPVTPSVAPGTYMVRLSGGREEHFFPAQLQ